LDEGQGHSVSLLLKSTTSQKRRVLGQNITIADNCSTMVMLDCRK